MFILNIKINSIYSAIKKLISNEELIKQCSNSTGHSVDVATGKTKLKSQTAEYKVSVREPFDKAKYLREEEGLPPLPLAFITDLVSKKEGLISTITWTPEQKEAWLQIWQTNKKNKNVLGIEAVIYANGKVSEPRGVFTDSKKKSSRQVSVTKEQTRDIKVHLSSHLKVLEQVLGL